MMVQSTDRGFEHRSGEGLRWQLPAHRPEFAAPGRADDRGLAGSGRDGWVVIAIGFRRENGPFLGGNGGFLK